MTNSAPPILAVNDLEKSFAGFAAVAGVTFDVGAGEMVALIGPNGAGKTTTFNMINGQIPVDRGTIRLAGRAITGASPSDLWRAGVARTFQITATFASMTVVENVAVALLSQSSDPSRGETRPGLIGGTGLQTRAALALLAEVGMEAAADRICGTLAYGDLKRVELAMALANQPRLLLMDEPTAGMAPQERSQLMARVSELARSRKTAVLFTEHDMDVVFGHAHRIIVMNRGVLIAEGRPDDVRRDPIVREVYLGQSSHGAPA